MFGWLLFLHIAGVAFWLGSAAAVFILQRKARRSKEPATTQLAQDTTRSIVRGVVNPSSLIVLITGIVMIVQMGFVGKAKPFWLSMMEQGGGMIVLLSIGLMSWQMRKLTRSSSEEARHVHLGRLANSLAGISLGVLAVILVVALRIA